MKALPVMTALSVKRLSPKTHWPKCTWPKLDIAPSAAVQTIPASMPSPELQLMDLQSITKQNSIPKDDPKLEAYSPTVPGPQTLHMVGEYTHPTIFEDNGRKKRRERLPVRVSGHPQTNSPQPNSKPLHSRKLSPILPLHRVRQTAIQRHHSHLPPKAEKRCRKI